MTFRDAHEHRSNCCGVGSVSDAHIQGDSNLAIVCRPICDRFVNELGIWQDDDDVVIGPDPSTAAPNANNVSIRFTNFDTIAELDRMLNQQYQTRNKIAYRILQSQANADSKSPTYNHQTGEVQPD